METPIDTHRQNTGGDRNVERFDGLGQGYQDALVADRFNGLVEPRSLIAKDQRHPLSPGHCRKILSSMGRSGIDRDAILTKLLNGLDNRATLKEWESKG